VDVDALHPGVATILTPRAVVTALHPGVATLLPSVTTAQEPATTATSPGYALDSPGAAHSELTPWAGTWFGSQGYRPMKPPTQRQPPIRFPAPDVRPTRQPWSEVQSEDWPAGMVRWEAVPIKAGQGLIRAFAEEKVTK